jgi:hypothetical protein
VEGEEREIGTAGKKPRLKNKGRNKHKQKNEVNTE